MESKKQLNNFNLVLESSDDEAPEEVTFEDSRAQALRSVKHALEIARREKELLKEKRRKRQELFQEQKKRKLLPLDVLEEMDAAPSKKQKESGDEDFCHGDEEKTEKTTKRVKTRTKSANTRSLKGNYTVTTVTKGPEMSMQQQAAQDFIQSRLYGPGSCRSTNNEMMSLQKKTDRKKGAAVQFVKKDWASKEKVRAEKLKKRWIHKQQVSSC